MGRTGWAAKSGNGRIAGAEVRRHLRRKGKQSWAWSAVATKARGQRSAAGGGRGRTGRRRRTARPWAGDGRDVGDRGRAGAVRRAGGDEMVGRGRRREQKGGEREHRSR